MRISSSLFFQTGLNSINAQQADLVHLFKQIGSGQRMVTPSDDPLAAAEAINVAQSQSMNLRYAENRHVAKNNLGNEENILNSVVDLMEDLKTTLVEIGNGTLSDADRLTLQNVLKETRTSLLGMANSTDGNGQYLFSGSQGNVQAFEDDGSYEGDTGQRLVQVDQTRRIPTGDNGLDIFARATPGVTRYISSADATNSGTAVVGNAAITNPALTDQDYTYKITFQDETNYTISFEYVGNGTAPVPAPADVTGELTGSGSQVITLPNSDGTDNGGVRISISGTPAANDTFVVEPAGSANMNVFETIDNLINALELQHAGSPENQAQFHNVLNSTMQRIDINYNNVLTVRSSVGARFNEIEAMDDSGALRNLSYRDHLSRLEDLDYYAATSQLELRRSALEAASLAFMKIQGTSMFNINR